MHLDLSDDLSPVPRRARITTALVTLLASLPSTVLGGLLVFAAGALIGLWPAFGLIAIWLVGGPLVPVPTAEMAQAIFPVRHPRPDEQGALITAWHNVARVAGVRASDYSLWVQDTAQLNALAAPGRIVAVTSAAVAELGPRELEAVLAHELGHHHGGAQRAQMMVYWYALPIRVCWQALVRITWLLAVFVARAAHIVGVVALLRAFGVRGAIDVIGITVAVLARIATILAVAVLAVLHFGPLAALPLAAIVVEPFAARAQRRRTEVDADRVAVDLGYGRETLAVLDLWSRRAEPAGRLARLLDTHPPIAARIAAVETRLAAPRST
ncbi:M48 family metalloprotease [Nocardia takedensis]|uniref:M48 family metalloprotease n=1 Tax=Nocardia takedensis TaxID=259390 RepID=UPI0002D5CE56|nr:M48 family metalloprotease [Nocardia takedensis]